MEIPKLPLNGMENRHFGLTPSIAKYYYEAACVCLDRNHTSPQEFVLKGGNFEKKSLIEWIPPDDRCKKAWANKDDATRDGAYACALAATELCFGLYAVRRAETLTGADYYVSQDASSGNDFENCLRLEVSGTDTDDYYEVQQRLNKKLKQAAAGASSLPAIAAIVGFKVKKILMEKVSESL